jgi:enoyl-CoA hydratase/carnithine racemase
MSVSVRIETAEGVSTLTLDRPDRLNAIDSDTIRQLEAHLDEIEGGTATRAIVVTGAGRCFSAGADITELSNLRDGADFARFVKGLTDALDRLAACAVPSIAAINGLALGGGLELALACDLRVAQHRARLGVPEIKLGLLPAGGGSQRLARMLPSAVAKHMLLTGAPLSAEDALRYGLVNALAEDALVAATDLARAIAAGPPRASATVKQLVDAGGEMSLAAGIELERDRVSALFDTEDCAEGIDAFLAKRPPRFTGR